MTGESSAKSAEVVFEQAVEGLLVIALKGRVTQTLKQRLKSIGIDLDQRLAPAYPRETWEQVLSITREELYPNASEEEGMRELGRLVVNGFAQTLIGRAVASFVRVVGPMRMMDRMNRNLRAAGNYNDTTLTERGPRACEIWINEARIHPAYCAGLLEAALVYAGVREPKIGIIRRDAKGTTYAVSW